MRQFIGGIAIAVGALTGILAAHPLDLLVASPVAAAMCSAGAEPVVTKSSESLELFSADEADALGAEVTTTVNYRGVTDLFLITRAVPFEESVVTGSTLVIPAWLLDAYGGSVAAILTDLEAGYLKDRGPCV